MLLMSLTLRAPVWEVDANMCLFVVQNDYGAYDKLLDGYCAYAGA